MTEITRQSIKVLADATQKALEAVADEHGLTVKVAGGSFDPTMGVFKPKVVFEAGNVAEKEFRLYAEMYGLKPDDFGREFTSQGRHFQITGVAPRSPKRPILANEIGTTKTFKFTETAVKFGLTAADNAETKVGA